MTHFISVQALRPDGVRLWTVMLDGSDRVGVLAVTVDADGESVRRLVRRLAGLVAELIVTKGMYTDAFFQLRRRQPMTLQAEMQWHLLPPRVLVTPRVSLGAALEPAYEVGGDAFDYALNGRMLHLAILDAMGHGLRAAAMCGIATAAYRHARRAAVGLEEIYAVMDQRVAEQFEVDEFVTAQVAELDTDTGVLRWINAGHPAPLLIRGDSMRTLTAETTLPVGFGGAAPVVAREQLHPGDRVLLFTDGATEQMTGRGSRIGDVLFEDLVARACASGLMVAETVRRLVEALLNQTDGEAPDDDATLFMVEWTGSTAP
jgi:serine phosphatase RsbU (regulator of sigma subunit)